MLGLVVSSMVERGDRACMDVESSGTPATLLSYMPVDSHIANSLHLFMVDLPH